MKGNTTRKNTKKQPASTPEKQAPSRTGEKGKSGRK